MEKILIEEVEPKDIKRDTKYTSIKRDQKFRK